MKKGLTLVLILMLFVIAFIGFSNGLFLAPGQADNIVGLWQGEVEIWDESYASVQIEFFDNGLVIVSYHDRHRHRREAFSWQQVEGVLHIEDFFSVELVPLHEDEMFLPIEPPAVPYEISDNRLTIEWDARFLGSLSGEYTRQPTLPLDSLNQHPLLGTWEFPSEEWTNARGIWYVETMTFESNGFGIANEISEMEHRQEMPFRWMVRGNQLYHIMDGAAVVDFRIAEGRLYISDDDYELVLTKR